MFEMALYRELPRARALLTGEDPTYGLGGEVVDQQKKADLERLANLVPEERRSAAKAVLRKLFPAVEHLTSRFGGGNGGHDSWIREARVCSPEFFARYFQLSVPDDDVSRHELEDILSVTGHQDELLKRFLGASRIAICWR